MRETDERAVERALERYGDDLYRLGISYLKNPDEAADAVQDALVRYMDARPVFESDAHEKAWLMRVTSNLCKNRLKSSWYRKRTELTDELPAAPSGDGEDGEVTRAVNSLPPKYRVAVYLYYYEGYSTDEIAKLTGSRGSTVRSRLARARRTLGNLLEGGDDFEPLV